MEILWYKALLRGQILQVWGSTQPSGSSLLFCPHHGQPHCWPGKLLDTSLMNSFHISFPCLLSGMSLLSSVSWSTLYLPLFYSLSSFLQVFKLICWKPFVTCQGLGIQWDTREMGFLPSQIFMWEIGEKMQLNKTTRKINSEECCGRSWWGLWMSIRCGLCEWPFWEGWESSDTPKTGHGFQALGTVCFRALRWEQTWLSKEEKGSGSMVNSGPGGAEPQNWAGAIAQQAL